ncbi:glycosyltransferase family 4 protein [Sphingomonas sp. RT2P30]|uniref:glycosyltransferase family 4 protein n=1 Tax=Parasphingomonas halimpatiens TaxID=3096162 RepID=UPI002FC87B90
MKLTIWCELAAGGIADYAHDQATALVERGIDVELLCPPSYLDGRTPTYVVKPVLYDARPRRFSRWKVVRAIQIATGLLANARIVARHVAERRSDAVLTHFSEYLAPLWAWRMRRLRRAGVRFFSVLHDPVRDYAVGPAWWHRWSVDVAFNMLDAVFVHTFDPVPVPAAVDVVWLPYGIHHFPDPTQTTAEVRRSLGIPDGAVMLTSFGYVRDNKNIDLVIRAIADLPNIYLIVAGSEQAGGNRPLSFYQDLAAELGCADRCRWINRFVSVEDTANLMAASDLSLLVYARRFVSSSAALGVTVNYRKPCLISSGSATTETVIKQYRLGIWVEPDDVASIRAGLCDWLENGIVPDWDGYLEDYGWARNARVIEQTILDHAAARAAAA